MKKQITTKTCCDKFECQTWRRSMCKNCFKSKEEHQKLKETSKDSKKNKDTKDNNKPSKKDVKNNTVRNSTTKGLMI